MSNKENSLKHTSEKAIQLASKARSAANELLAKIDHGMESDESIVTFHNNTRTEDQHPLKHLAETAAYAGMKQLIDPIHAVIKATMGETMYGQPVSKAERAKALGEVAITVFKIPKRVHDVYTVCKLGAEIYKLKKNQETL